MSGYVPLQPPLKCHTRWHQYPYKTAHFSFADDTPHPPLGYWPNGTIFECPRCGTKYLYWSYGDNNPFMKLRWWHLRANARLRRMKGQG